MRLISGWYIFDERMPNFKHYIRGILNNSISLEYQLHNQVTLVG